MILLLGLLFYAALYLQIYATCRPTSVCCAAWHYKNLRRDRSVCACCMRASCAVVRRKSWNACAPD